MRAPANLKSKDTTLDIVGVAERLYDQIGFQKTTVADIARELSMSPANVYRFYAAKSGINEAVARKLLTEIEAAINNVVEQKKSANEKLRAFFEAIEKSHLQRFALNRKLHELLVKAYDEDWQILRPHHQVVHNALAEIISQGNREGVFNVGDCAEAATQVRTACIRFCHPRLIVEFAQDAKPTLDQMVDLFIRALA
ncbi:DNA-binding transcriptional regulator, AcrR family [Methylocapsa palsarum]|uniref:DNA-binding transcriptional regulator, AcrR family n=2 Tax=Methylocapsa palsarum TaxID=1612308 RepID=A0A1I3Y087_9HYPH|nr:DNA-binding transcriptional regulator, AcrR family [Methylocapsa palsarum]